MLFSVTSGGSLPGIRQTPGQPRSQSPRRILLSESRGQGEAIQRGSPHSVYLMYMFLIYQIVCYQVINEQ